MATATASVAAPSLAHFVGDSSVSDFTLRINGTPFPVLAGLMCMRSRALHGLFDTGAVEAEQREWTFELPFVDAATTKQLLEHCYGDPLVLTAERLQGLWVLSRYLQLDHVPHRLVEAAPALLPCSAILLSAKIEAPELIAAAAPTVDINPSDAGRCLELALHAGSSLLRERAAAVAATRLSASELSELPAAALHAVLQTDQLLHGEDEVLAAVAEAIARESLGPEQAGELLAGIRLELLSNEGLLRARALGVCDGRLLSAALRYRVSDDRPRALPANHAAAVVAALGIAAGAFGIPRTRTLCTAVIPRSCRRPDSNWGLAFDIRAKAACAITALCCARGDDDPCTVRIFVCDGSYEDHSSSPGDWRLVTPQGAVALEKKLATPVPFAEPVYVAKGAVQGFLILSVQFAARMLISPDSPALPEDEFIQILPGNTHHAPAESPSTIPVNAAKMCFVGSVEYLALPPPPPSETGDAASEVHADNETTAAAEAAAVAVAPAALLPQPQPSFPCPP